MYGIKEDGYYVIWEQINRANKYDDTPNEIISVERFDSRLEAYRRCQEIECLDSFKNTHTVYTWDETESGRKIRESTQECLDACSCKDLI